MAGESKLKEKNSEERDHSESDLSAGWFSGWGEVLSGNSRHAANCKLIPGRQPDWAGNLRTPRPAI
jgi:hypothetical protein